MMLSAAINFLLDNRFNINQREWAAKNKYTFFPLYKDALFTSSTV